MNGDLRMDAANRTEDDVVSQILKFDIDTPAFIVSEDLLLKNLSVLDRVKRESGAKILLALKAFAMYKTFPLLNTVLDGVCASSPNEARLGREEFGGIVESFAAAYSDADMEKLLLYSDHIVFNSFQAKEKFSPLIKAFGRDIEIGIRLNPELSTTACEMYDPCSKKSRLGVRKRDFRPDKLDDVDGFHWHTLCEQNADDMKKTLDAAEKKWGSFFKDRKWLNLGGGHHITRADYNVGLLTDTIKYLRTTYGCDVYLEPGEAVALNAGYLIASVLDIIDADMPIAVLDASAACHMPDVLEMPYRPNVIGSAAIDVKKYSYRLAGKSCLAGDVIGEYSFDRPLKTGDRLLFCDMAIYSMVKTNTFNGLDLPSLCLLRQGGEKLDVVRRFSYSDFKGRL